MLEANKYVYVCRQHRKPGHERVRATEHAFHPWHKDPVLLQEDGRAQHCNTDVANTLRRRLSRIGANANERGTVIKNTVPPQVSAFASSYDDVKACMRDAARKARAAAEALPP